MTSTEHARLTQLFSDAIELDLEQQTAMLAALSSTEPALADALRELLELDRNPQPSVDVALRAAAKLEDSIGNDVTLAATTPRASQAPAEMPAIEGYELLSELGTGGMGTVYAAQQLVPTRRVAIKVLHARSSAALARFFAEAEIMARLDHRGIAKVLQVGITDGRPYIAMEYVDGVTLDEHIGRARPDTSTRLELFAELCDVVHYAHIKGVIHRDLKPSNVMVRADGGIAVLDFGIARLSDGGGETRDGELVGTPVYMSPEQARLQPDRVDARSDVYTLGVVIYELLTGRLPYDVRGRPLAETARKICDEDPVRLSRIAPALRGDLDAITHHALEKEPERRYQAVASLADDVRRYLDHRTVSVRSPNALERTRRFVRRRPMAGAAIGVSVTATIATIAIVTHLWLAASRAEARALAAGRVVAHHNDELVLDRARAELLHDPTAAAAAIRSVIGHDIDSRSTFTILELAVGMGVATDVHRAGADGLRWAEAIGGDGLVTAGFDGRALLWTRDSAFTLYSAPARIHIATPSPDGARILIGADNGVARIVDRSARLIAVTSALHDAVRFGAWSDDGRAAAAGSDRGEVWLWRDGHAPTLLRGPASAIRSLAFDRDGQTLVAGDDRGGVWDWELATGHVATATAGTGRVMSVVSDNGVIATIDQSGNLRRWTIRGDALIADGAIAGPPCKVGTIDRRGRFAITGGPDGSVMQLVDGHAALLGKASQEVRTVAVSSDGRWVAAASDDGVIHAWNLATGRRVELHGHPQRIRQVEFARGGAVLVSADSAGFVRRWDLDAIAPSYLRGGTAPILRVAVSTDGTSAASIDDAGELRRWDLVTGRSSLVETFAQPIDGLVFANHAAVTVTSDGAVSWWYADGSHRTVHVDGAHDVIARADGFVAVATRKAAIQLLSPDGATTTTLDGRDGGSLAMALSPDGKRFASAGRIGGIRIWQLDRPNDPPIVIATAAKQRFVKFAVDRQLLIAAGDDGVVRACDVTTGASRILATHPGTIAALDVDRDRVVSIGNDRSIAIAKLDAAIPTRASQPADDDDLELISTDAGAVLDVAALGGGSRDPIHATCATSQRELTLVGTVDGSLAVLRHE
ncbi:MAG TPA: serine/threonine-protein kinase [Kofleriaceae bacterium]|jgi:WD40 repeat protein/predicted Ser/Thr protein kinase